MVRCRREEYLGLTYHVYCRGVRRTTVFHNEAEYWAFVWDLRRLAHEHGTRVLAYCLMPNHPHLCLRTEGDPLSLLMQRLNLRHAKRFNRGHQVSGHLNEARYCARVVDSEQYLLTLVRYIHQNPVRAGLCPGVGDWSFSSHRAYLSRKQTWIQTADVLQRTGGTEGYLRLMSEPLSPEALQEIRALGRKEASQGEQVASLLPREWMRRPGPWSREAPAISIAAPADRVAAALGIEIEALAAPDRGGAMRSARQQFARELRALGYPLREIAALLRRDQATVSRLARSPGPVEMRAVPDYVPGDPFESPGMAAVSDPAILAEAPALPAQACFGDRLAAGSARGK